VPKAFILLEDVGSVNEPPRIVGEQNVTVGQVIVLDGPLGQRARINRIRSFPTEEVPFAYARLID